MRRYPFLPPPEHNAANVKGIFSDRYGNADGLAHTDWRNPTVVGANLEYTYADNSDDKLAHITPLDYDGFTFTTLTEHYDHVYMNVFLVGNDSKNFDIHVNYDTTDGTGTKYRQALQPGWNTFDVDLAALDGDKNKNYYANCVALDCDGGNGEIYVDNIFFYNTPEVASVQLDAADYNPYAYVRIPLTVTCKDGNGSVVNIDGKPVYTVSDPTIGSVDENGVFVGLKSGTVKVTATYNDKSDDCEITVKAIPESPDPTADKDHVIGVYSDSYNQMTDFANNVWKDGSAVVYKDVVFENDAANHFHVVSDNANWGFVFENGRTLDVSGYDYMSIDVMRLAGGTGSVRIIPRGNGPVPDNQGKDSGGNDYDWTTGQFAATELNAAGTWTTIQVPIGAFQANADGTTYKDAMKTFKDVFIRTVGDHSTYAVDNIYFYKSTANPAVAHTNTTGENITDKDKRGIDWNKALCYVDKIVWVKRGDVAGENIETTSEKFPYMHDGDNETYYDITREQTDGANEHVQILVQLKKPITVSDVELIWANGYADKYDVYALKDYPVVGGQIPSSVLTRDNWLFGYGTEYAESVAKTISYEPYFETQSQLQDYGGQNGDTQFLLLDLKHRGNGSTFGYFFDEIHVGAYDSESYNVPHHLGIPDYMKRTDETTELEITVRNERNAILSEYGAYKKDGSNTRITNVRTEWESTLLKRKNESQVEVYAVTPGNYTVEVSGSVDGIPMTYKGEGIYSAHKDWRDESEANGWKSLVQQVFEKHYDANKSEAENTEIFKDIIIASQSELDNGKGYYPWKAADGKVPDDINEEDEETEKIQKQASRWSSFVNGSIPWVGDDSHDLDYYNEQRLAQNKNQYWMIDLGESYELTNIEIVWERAYAESYSVYGFKEKPTETVLTELFSTDEETVKKYDEQKLYSYSPNPENFSGYPLHDEHSQNSENGAIPENNHTQWLLIKMDMPAAQKPSMNRFGFSMWEVYAWGTSTEIADNVDALDDAHLSVKSGKEATLNLTAYKQGDADKYKDDEWFPVEFRIKEEGFYNGKADGSKFTGGDDEVKGVKEYDAASGKNLWHFRFFNEAGQLIAEIIDNDNGTYTVKAGKIGHGQKEHEYDDGGKELEAQHKYDTSYSSSGTHKTSGTYADGNKSYSIEMISSNSLDKKFEPSSWLELVVFKNKMELIAEVSDKQKLVFDDGYYSEDRIKEKSSDKVTIIDLRNVDFVTDNDGKALDTQEIPVPRTITKADDTTVKMNPNALIYVPQTDFDGEHSIAKEKRIHGKGDNTGVDSENIVYLRDDGKGYYVRDLCIYDGYDYSPYVDLGTTARRARYFTNIPKNKDSFFLIPFVPRYSDFNREGKEIKLHKPSNYQSSEGTITLTEMTEGEVNVYSGTPAIINTASDKCVSSTGGYAVVFYNKDYISKDKFDTYGDTYAGGNMPASINASIADVDLGNNAVLKGTYVTKTGIKDSEGGYNYFFYSAGENKFVEANSSLFDFSDGGSTVTKPDQGKDMRGILKPFYAMLQVSTGSSPAKMSVRFVYADATGIAEVDSDASSERVNVYTTDGVLVRKGVSPHAALSGLPKGIYIVNGKKYVK